MGTAPILEMVRAYSPRPRLWLLARIKHYCFRHLNHTIFEKRLPSLRFSSRRCYDAGPVHTTPENLKMRQSGVILDLCLAKNWTLVQ